MGTGQATAFAPGLQFHKATEHCPSKGCCGCLRASVILRWNLYDKWLSFLWYVMIMVAYYDLWWSGDKIMEAYVTHTHAHTHTQFRVGRGGVRRGGMITLTRPCARLWCCAQDHDAAPPWRWYCIWYCMIIWYYIYADTWWFCTVYDDDDEDDEDEDDEDDEDDDVVW